MLYFISLAICLYIVFCKKENRESIAMKEFFTIENLLFCLMVATIPEFFVVLLIMILLFSNEETRVDFKKLFKFEK